MYETRILIILFNSQRLLFPGSIVHKLDMFLVSLLEGDGVELPLGGEHQANLGEGRHHHHVVQAEVQPGGGPGVAPQPVHLSGPGQHQAAVATDGDIPDRRQMCEDRSEHVNIVSVKTQSVVGVDSSHHHSAIRGNHCCGSLATHYLHHHCQSKFHYHHHSPSQYLHQCPPALE